jgi:hypothetical protein
MTAQVEKPSPFRIGVIVDSLLQPRWVRKCLENVVAKGLGEIVAVVRVAEESSRRGLLYELYSRIDRRLFESDALELVSIEDLVSAAAKSEELTTADLDVVTNFASTDLNAKYADAAKHGVWFYCFGERPGFNEVMNEVPVMTSSLRSLKGDREQVLYESFSPTLSRFSVRLNNNNCYWKSAAFVARGLRNLSAGEAGIEPVNAIGNAQSSGALLKLPVRAASRAVEKLASFEQWVLAYQIGDGEFNYLIPPADRFWADPFPIKVDGKHYIFFEDYVNELGKAHLAVVEVDRDGIVSGPTEILKLDCHLSYPFVFEWQGDYYMIPETGERNVVELYRCTSFPFGWEPHKVLLEANSPLDATLIEVNGTWWMFVNIQEEGVAVNWDELHLYYAESPLGPWQPHARNPVVSDVRSARPAGRLFWANDVLYRPSQDSSLRYGYATTVSKVTRLSPDEYSETEVLKILPNWDKDIIGVHTLNFIDGFTVIDCLARRSRFRNRRLNSPQGLAKSSLVARASSVA